MEPHHEAKLDAHLATLSPAKRDQWAATGQQATQNEHDEKHPSWNFIHEVAKWLGIGSPGVAAAGAFHQRKMLARKLARR